VQSVHDRPRLLTRLQNEDCGQMSAWYIFSAMGFYPVSPVSGEYVVGSYVLPALNIHLRSMLNRVQAVLRQDHHRPSKR
jgi:putative alpha-1,2-mannosidase